MSFDAQHQAAFAEAKSMMQAAGINVDALHTPRDLARFLGLAGWSASDLVANAKRAAAVHEIACAWGKACRQ